MGLINDAMTAAFGDGKGLGPAEQDRAAQEAKRAEERRAYAAEVKAKTKADAKKLEEDLRNELRKPAKDRNPNVLGNGSGVDSD